MGFAQLDIERLQIFKNLGFSPCCIYDIGASNGRWTKRIAEVFPTAIFHLFEPLANFAPRYKQGLDELSQLSINSTLHSFALGASCGTTTMGVSHDSVGSSVLMNRITKLFPISTEIEVATIDSVVENLSLPFPQLIKLDTQGYELEILKGAVKTLDHVEIILLESWLTRAYGNQTPLWFEIASWLSEHSFFLLDITEEYRNEDGILTAQDLFFVKQPSSIEKLNQNRTFASPRTEIAQMQQKFYFEQAEQRQLQLRFEQLQLQLQDTEKQLKQYQKRFEQTQVHVHKLKRKLQQTQKNLKLLRGRLVSRTQASLSREKTDATKVEDSSPSRLDPLWAVIRKLLGKHS